MTRPLKLIVWSAYCVRSRRSESTGWCVRQRSSTARHRTSADRRDGAPGRPTVRHIPTASRLTRMRQQNTRTVSTIIMQRVIVTTTYTMGHKNVPLYFYPYLRQLLTDFLNSLLAHFADNLK